MAVSSQPPNLDLCPLIHACVVSDKATPGTSRAASPISLDTHEVDVDQAGAVVGLQDHGGAAVVRAAVVRDEELVDAQLLVVLQPFDQVPGAVADLREDDEGETRSTLGWVGLGSGARSGSRVALAVGSSMTVRARPPETPDSVAAHSRRWDQARTRVKTQSLYLLSSSLGAGNPPSDSSSSGQAVSHTGSVGVEQGHRAFVTCRPAPRQEWRLGIE